MRVKTRLRKSTRHLYLTLAIILIIVCSCNLFSIIKKQKIKQQRKEIYSYSNKFEYTYNVNLIKNKYIKEQTLNMEYKAYITDLIDNIDLNLNYNYFGSIATNIDYKYRILGRFEGTYVKENDEQKIWKEEEVLKDYQTGSLSDENLNITENLKLNLRSQNNLIKEFQQQIGMSIDAKYLVVLQFETNTVADGENINNNFEKTIYIDLGQKTTTISIDQNQNEDTNYISKEYSEKSSLNPVMIIINIGLIALGIYFFRYALKTRSANRIKNTYREELNRILRICEDKIVKVRTKPTIIQDNLVEVKDFGEIIKVSEELFKPILCWENPQKEESWFTVMSSNVIYRYILER